MEDTTENHPTRTDCLRSSLHGQQTAKFGRHHEEFFFFFAIESSQQRRRRDCVGVKRKSTGIVAVFVFFPAYFARYQWGPAATCGSVFLSQALHWIDAWVD